jgi:hypothetical protein
MILVPVSLAAVLILLAFGLMFLRLAKRVNAPAGNPEWLESITLERYAPMERLLQRSDFAFLEAQPGYRPGIGARLLAERRKAFAGYLRLMTHDFDQLLGLAKWMLVHSTTDRPEFGKALWRQHIAFYCAVYALRFRVAFYPLGFAGVDARKLVDSLASLRDGIQQLALQRVEAV